MSLNWLITGGCGFIGRNLIRRLLREPEIGIRVFDNGSVCDGRHLAEVCAYEPVPDGTLAPSTDKVQLLSGDITNADDVAQAVQHMDVIVHLAANTGVPKSVADPVQDFRFNALGTFTMLNCARSHGGRRFIFASSGAPTGNAVPPITEKAVAAPVSPYGASKLAGEGYCSAWFHCYGWRLSLCVSAMCTGPIHAIRQVLLPSLSTLPYAERNGLSSGTASKRATFCLLTIWWRLSGWQQ